MNEDEGMITFGPVPSRRLGKSLGINNIPPKICTYACIYCQLGRTLKMQIDRKPYYSTETIVSGVKERLKELKKRGERVDYLTFVPDGEPTLDLNLKNHILALKSFGIKIAVITNSSLIADEDVKEALKPADWVSFKVDAVTEDIWRKIDRSHGKIKLEEILRGIKDFSKDFNGTLVTETMLVNGINNKIEELEDVSGFIANIKADMAYISVPTRPPAENWVKPPSEYDIYVAFDIFKNKGFNVELLIGYEGNAFAFTGDVEEDLLSITSVHPMREDAVEEYLKKAKSGWDKVEKLLEEGRLIRVNYNNTNFYLRKLS